MGNIRVLDDHLANQIAAGEVVERPSSVVKELVENAIDAGSGKVDVTVEEGGIQFIRVVDDGSGIEPDDVEVAFERHATSKIRTGKDLFAIRSLGFRGEALPSIAAVSRVELISSAGDDGLGRRLVIEGGKKLAFEETAQSRGTDFRVRDLFFNTPARLKYMKTVQTELGHITDYMYRLALSHPDIAFRLVHNGTLLLDTSGNGDLQQAAASVYGTATAKRMIPIRAETPDYVVSGWIARPDVTRSNRNGITTVVNGRFVRNFQVTQAILTGYHTLLPINRYPLAIVRLEMDPSLVDVNVHPAKLEVRFSKDAELTAAVQQAVRDALRKETLIPSGLSARGERRVLPPTGGAPKPQLVQEQLRLYETRSTQGAASPTAASPPAPAWRPAAEPPTAPPPTSPPPLPSEDADRGAPHSAQPSGRTPIAPTSAPAPSDVHTRQGQAPSSNAAPPAASSPQRSYDRAQPARPSAAPASAPQRAWDPRDAERMLRSMAPPQAPRPPADEAADTASDEAPDAASTGPRFPHLHPIGQLHGTYIVAQNEEGLFLIDQHAAHERINYEAYYKKFGDVEAVSQMTMFSHTIEFTSAEAQLLKTRLPLLESVGVYLEPFGGNTFKVRSHPVWFPQGEEAALIEEMAQWALSEKHPDVAKIREASAIMCSCKASIKANQAQSIPALEKLLERLAACQNPFTCPHGRPIVVSFTTRDLEKMFKRVM
ncbi:DNA mismatch repair endonuclease MutL [Paenibacillus sp. TRM 82003]|nr:DNA mismatch repair endonuclease MutL [Paenibacillus sp. TRM 82003]